MKSTYVILLLVAACVLVSYQEAFAATTMDSLVNLATQARSQIKIQLDRTADVSAEVREMYAKGDAETNSLIAAVERGNDSAAKQHFMSAMKIFRQITQTFSEQAQAARDTTPAETTLSVATQASEVVSRNNLIRAEKYIETLRNSAVKNNLDVDFGKAYEIIKNAKDSLAKGDYSKVDALLEELKVVQAQIQEQIKEQSIQQSNARVRAFVSDYLAQIDAILNQTTELGLTEEDVAKLTQIKRELEMTQDANQLVVKIKHYSVTINIVDYRNEKIGSEISKIERKLAGLEADSDDETKSKIDTARQMIIRIKNSTSSDEKVKGLALLDSTIKEIEVHIKSKDQKTPPAQERASQNAEKAQDLTVQEEKQTRTQDTEKQESVPERQTQAPERAAQTPAAEKKQEERAVPAKEKTENSKGSSSSEVQRLENRMAKIEPRIDDSVKSRFEMAKELLERIKNQAETNNAALPTTIRILDVLLDQIEDNLKWQENAKAAYKKQGK
jgi:uncharacterized protein YjaG (DUF416 family)